MGTNLAKASQEYRKLLSYVLDQPHGAKLGYLRVEHDTGVKMNTAGKTKLRRAIVASGHEYSVEPNIGYVLAAVATASAIADTRTQEVESRFRKLDRSLTVLAEAFLEELPDQEKELFTLRISVTRAMKSHIEQSKRLYSRKPPKQVQGTAEYIALPST
jgi:hypothetical protein